MTGGIAATASAATPPETPAGAPAAEAGDFVPARVVPHPTRPSRLQMVRAARRDLLSVWWETAFRRRIIAGHVLGRQIFVANCPEAVRHVMLTHNARYERKSPQMRRALEHLLGDGLFVSDGATWKFRRRAVNPTVHRNKLDRFTPMMVEAAEERAAAWQARGPQGRVDMLSEMAALTAEVISRAVFGSELGSAAADDVIQGFSDYQRRIDQFNLGYFLGADEGWPAFRGPRLRASTRKVHRVVDGIVARHAAGEGERDALVSLLMDVRDKDSGAVMDRIAIRNEAATIFMAGHETTAASMTWLWYLLAHAPETEARVLQELDTVVGARAPTMSDVPKLRFTQAVIDETLRLYPPVPVLSRQAAEDDEIEGKPMEAGGLVLVIPWLLHRHREYWRAPDAFRPERFLDPAQKPEPFTYVPFAAGPRICAGMSFAQYEMVLLLAVLLRRFRPRVAPGHEVRPVCRLTLRPAGGMPMDLNPVDP